MGECLFNGVAQVIDAGIRLAVTEENLLGDALPAKAYRGDIQLSDVFL